MVTKISNVMLEGGSVSNSFKAGANNGQFVTLDSNGDIPPALIGPVADQFRITVDQAITASEADINSTWERVDTTTQGTTGAGFQMAESSGVFTFPMNGIYLVTLHCQIARTSTNIDLITARIKSTSDGFVDSENTVNHAVSILGVTGSVPKEVSAMSTLINVTNTTNHKVKFTIQADDTGSELDGDSNFNSTYATFLRIVGT